MSFYTIAQHQITNGHFMAYVNADQKSDRVDYVHPEFVKDYHKFELTNRYEHGLDGVLELLQQLPNEARETFNNRQKLATLKNFVTKLGHQITGKITRKPSQILNEGPFLSRVLDHIDGVKDYNEFIKDIIFRLTMDGTVWLIADAPKEGLDGEPFLQIRGRGEVINWRYDQADQLDMAVVYETIQEPYGKFGQKSVEQYRHYYMENGLCHIDVWQTVETSLVIKESIVTDFDFMPIERIKLEGEPLLYGVAKLNTRHFNHSSNLDRYMVMSVLPQPLLWGCGVDEEGEYKANQPAMVLGVDQAIFFDQPKSEADFEWRELSGTSIEAMNKHLENLEVDMMSALNQAMKDQAAQTNSQSATGAAINNQDSAAMLSIIAMRVQQGMQQSLESLSKMFGEEFTGEILINQDFTPSLDAANLPTLLQAKVQGEISQDTWLNALNASEAVTIDDLEKEKQKISDELSGMLDMEGVADGKVQIPNKE